jgi:HD-like signal output (HDOD) protein
MLAESGTAISNEDLARAMSKLPTAPRLFVEVGELMQNEHAEVGEMVAVLRQDQALVARIVRTANSVAYSPPEPIGSLERAMDFLGFAEVHRLIGAVSAVQLSAIPIRLYPLSGPRLRQHALFTAVLMEELAKPAGERPRSCYTVGLLRTIGILALEQLVPAGHKIPPYAGSGEPSLDEWERKYWGVPSVEITERVLHHWRLPHETVRAIRDHYNPAGMHNPISHLLRLAASAAADRDFGITGEEVHWKLTPENFTKAGLEQREYHHYCERAQRKFEQLRNALG